MLSKKMLVASTMLAVGILYAQDIELNTAESWYKQANIKTVEDGVFEITGRTSLVSPTILKIDPAKTYKISGQLRQIAGEKIRTNIGFMGFDEKKRVLPTFTFNVIAGSDTELIEDIKPTDTTLKVKDAAKWKKYIKYSRIALNAADDYSDIPNFTYIAQEIKDVQKDGDVWVVTLDKPAGNEAKAGSKVRLHADGGYIYTGGTYVPVPGGDWEKFSGSIKGYGKYGFSAYKAWPPGTIYARIVILANWNSSSSSDILQLKNIKVEVID